MSQQINLYESRLKPKHELPTGRNLGIALIVVLLLLVPIILWAQQQADEKAAAAAIVERQHNDEQNKFTELAKAMAERKVSSALVSELSTAKAALNMREEIIAYLDSGAVGNTTGFSGVLSGFSQLSQSDLWLTGFTVTNGGLDIEIRGRLFDQAKLPAYVKKLGQESPFQGRRFATLEMKSVDPKDDKKTAFASAPSAASVEPAKLVPYVEFILRSENVDAALTKAPGEKR